MANINNLTNEQIKQGYSTIEGAYDPVTGKLKTATNVITPDALAPQPKIQLPQTPQPITPTVSPAQNMVSDLIAQYDLSQTEQQAQNFQNQGLEQYLKDIVGLQGETQALATEKEKAGVGTLRQDLQNINSQILKKQAELQQDDIQLIANMRAEERRDTLLPFAQMGQAKLAGDAQIVRALKNAEIGVLNAQALAKQGDISLAQQTAEEAVAVKYAPYKERIQSYENIVKALQPFLTSAEKKEANKQKLKGDLVMKEIEKEEAKDKAIENMLIQAGVYQAPQNLIAQAQNIKANGGSVADVARILGKYSPDYLDYKIKQATLNKTNIEAEKANRELAQIKAQIKAAENGTGVSFAQLSEKQQDTALKLRGTYTSESKDFVTVRDAYNRIQASATDPSAAGDLALIFNYMKVLDPGSTVREGEFATAQNSAGVPDIIRAQYNKVQSGKRLADTQRTDFVDRSKKLFEAQKLQQQKINDNYSFLTQSAGIPPEFVVRDITSAVDSETQTLNDLYKANIPQNSATSILDAWLSPLKPN